MIKSTAPIGPTISTGPKSPTGPDANTYSFNPLTGNWENAYYSWNPTTKQTQPKTPQTYSYNPTTGKWDTQQWAYSPSAGHYVPNVTSYDLNPITLQKLPSDPPKNSLLSNGPNSNNAINQNATNNGTFNLFYDAKISNNIRSNAVSGNALVDSNTIAGDAMSGNALAIANILNLLQSSWGSGMATFNATVNGNLQGNLYIDPNQLGNKINVGTANNLSINSVTDKQLNNNINLTATSGNAGVSRNMTGGNAVSGDANAVANVLNVLNSTVAGKSFVGVLNVMGNFNGDLLIPANLLNSFIAGNGPSTANTYNATLNNNLTANTTNNTTVNNTIVADATSGKAAVSNNTTAGSATTGNALVNSTILNLLGQDIVGKDALLVFVNVLGKWNGLILNAPRGTTAGAFGGDITQATNNNVQLNSLTNNVINNNINVNAKSGDASVTSNTRAGFARSGNATASVNILNLQNSKFKVNDWLGVLFINVFGNWSGSFGVDSTSGLNNIKTDKPATFGSSTSTHPNNVHAFNAELPTSRTISDSVIKPGIFRFVPSPTRRGLAPKKNATIKTASASTRKVNRGTVLGKTTTHPLPPITGSTTNKSNVPTTIAPIMAGLVAFLFLFGERALALSRRLLNF
ncbi:MAG: hypothetical protein NVS1B7_6040 [Candidatus Saccharimonadales bacterium]